jgi:hypothetical protein
VVGVDDVVAHLVLDVLDLALEDELVVDVVFPGCFCDGVLLAHSGLGYVWR